MPCTTVTNFCSEHKVMLLLSVLCYQGLLCFRHIHDTDAIAINKLFELNFRYFTMYFAKSATGLSRLF